MPENRRAAVIGGNRIPFARANGADAKASNRDVLTATLDGLTARFGPAGDRLGEVAGAVLKHGPRGPSVSRAPSRTACGRPPTRWPRWRGGCPTS